MLLKSIDIKGFKSFADKTELEFKKGITALVGPNGSGKSNISDAVKWVLGEQSVKSLRGNKMEDIIFAGTKYRKSVGLAYVSLTLDNSLKELPIDYSDVTISRRLYRSGDSEYYINNTQCRLKDIQELFMDTGIGKEGYSIIGQGKIDAILNGRSEDRRGLFEEAAGIVKYKTRKLEAQRKLDKTSDNLIRINDILSTYEDRIEPLGIESEKAKQFLDYSNDLKVKEINVILDAIDKYNIRLNSIDQAIKNFDEKFSILINSKTVQEETLVDLNSALQSLEEKNNLNKKLYYEKKSAFQSFQGESNVINERIDNLSKIIEKSTNDITISENKISDMSSCLDQVVKERSIDLSSQNNLLNKINEKISNGNINIKLNEENKLKLDNLKEEDIDLLSLIAEVKNSTIILKNDSEVFKNRLNEIKMTCEDYKKMININSINQESLTKSIDKIKEDSNSIQLKIKDVNIDINNESFKKNTLKTKLNENLTSLNKTEVREHFLISLQNSYEGYNNAVKSIMKEFSSKCSVLGEILTLDKRYEKAIETALGGAISDIITQTESDAKYFIEYLKKGKYGRATFLPLNIINSRPINIQSKLEKTEGYLGIGNTLVSFDAKYKKAVDYRLGRVIIATDMDSAVKIAKLINFSFKIITLEGEVLNIGGSLTGGSNHNNSTGPISRKREITECKNKETLLKKEIHKINSDIDKINISVINNKEKIDKYQCTLNENNIEITKLQGKFQAIFDDSSKINNNLKISSKEIETINDSIKNKTEEIEIKKTNINNLIEKEKNIILKIEDLENQIQSLEKNELVNSKEITQLKIEQAKIDEVLIGKDKEVARLEHDLKEKQTGLNQLKMEHNKDNELLINLKNGLSKKLKDMDSISSEYSSLEQSFKQDEISITNCKEKINKTDENLKDINLEINKNQQEKHKTDILHAKLDTEKDNVYKELNEIIGLTYAEAKEYKILDANIGEYKKAIVELKNNIAELGNINVAAIEEYKEISEKYNFMNTQRQDLNDSRKEISSLIDSLTKQIKEVFNKNFEVLKINFNTTFKELFNGGSADLILKDDCELNYDIEINVEPPGKKLQNIKLLSGGEKVLSAIALLFAILKMKPTPFCILDEIEAALDDANVLRYGKFLNKYKDSVQFIVITHRKGTMEACDVLYGITMEEKGVSKIVSVDLKNQEE